jgi:hypothetical protein
MGSGNTKNIEYNSFTSEEKSKILEDFKLTYADKSKKKLTLVKTIYKPYEYIVYSNNYKIKLKNEPDLIEFVCEIGRPFIITYLDSTYSIHFVYGKNLK